MTCTVDEHYFGTFQDKYRLVFAVYFHVSFGLHWEKVDKECNSNNTQSQTLIPAYINKTKSYSTSLENSHEHYFGRRYS